MIQAQVDNHHFDASGTSKAMFDELAERSLMSPLAGTKHTFVRLAIIIHCEILALFQDFNLDLYISASYFRAGYISVIFRIVLPLLTCPPLSPWIIGLVSVMDV